MRGFTGSSAYGNYRAGGQRRLTSGVKLLMIANGIMYLLQMLVGHDLIILLGLTPAAVLQNLSVHQVVTYMFLHGGLFHILINMFILWMFGTDIENAWGTKQFFKYYLLTGVAGGVFSIIFQPYSMVPIIGASGAIYGLLVAYAMMYPNRILYLYFLFPLKAKYFVLIFVGLEFLASFSATSDGVAHLAHLGGAAVGFVYLKLDWRLRRLFQAISPRRFIGRLRYRKKSRKMEKNRQKTEEVMKRVDQILDKINAVGIENISEDDREFLGSASDILSKRDK